MPVAIISKSSGKAYTFKKFPVFIGRSSSCSVPISGKGVSRRHAQIDYVVGSDTFEVTDMESLNGIRVNGNKVTSAVLESGDKISVGDVELVFRSAGGKGENTEQSSANEEEPLVDDEPSETSESDFAEMERMIDEDRSDADNSAMGDALESKALNYKVSEKTELLTPIEKEKSSAKNKGRNKLAIALLSSTASFLFLIACFFGYQVFFAGSDRQVVTSQPVTIVGVDRSPKMEMFSSPPGQSGLNSAPFQAGSNSQNQNNPPGSDAYGQQQYGANETQMADGLNDSGQGSIEPLYGDGMAGELPNEIFDEEMMLAGGVPDNGRDPQGFSGNQMMEGDFFESTRASYQTGNGPKQPRVAREFTYLPSKKNTSAKSLRSGAGFNSKAKVPRFLTVDDLPAESGSGAVMPKSRSINRRSASSSRASSSANSAYSPSRRKSVEEWEQEARKLLDTAVARYVDGYGRKVATELKAMMVNRQRLSSGLQTRLRTMNDKMQLLVSMYYVGDKAFKAGDKKAAFAAWGKFMRTEKEQLGTNETYYTKLVNGFVVKEYFQRADQAVQNGNYHDAYRFWAKASKIDETGKAEREIRELDRRAYDLFEDGLAQEQTDIQSAIQAWQDVLQLVPPGHDLHTKASGKISWHRQQW